MSIEPKKIYIREDGSHLYINTTVSFVEYMTTQQERYNARRMGRIYIYTILNRMVVSVRDAEKIWIELMSMFLMDEIIRPKESVDEKIMVDMEEIYKAERMYD